MGVPKVLCAHCNQQGSAHAGSDKAKINRWCPSFDGRGYLKTQFTRPEELEKKETKL